MRAARIALRTGAFFDSLAAIQLLLPTGFMAGGFSGLRGPGASGQLALESAALLLGWASIEIWASVRPTERRPVLYVGLAVVAVFLIQNVWLLSTGRADRSSWAIVGLQIALVALYLIAVRQVAAERNMNSDHLVPASSPIAARESFARILPASDEDLPAISRLHQHFWGECSDVATMSKTLAALADDPDHTILAARVDGVCIGTATGVICHGLYGGADSYMVVEDMVVDPEHRRSGVGSALLTHLEDVARARGCAQMVLLTESVRSDARGLYTANGFADRWTGFKKKL